jgi:hypothetical protein
MTEDEIREMSQGGIPIPGGTNLPPQPSQPQSFQYFRRCPTCGHLEAVNTPVVQPFLQTPVPQPIKPSPDKISVLNGPTLEEGGVEAEWR